MNPLINLLHLKFFCDAVTYNSISESAKMNFVTQSAVSQAISKLEIVLGTQIVVHSRQKFQVTEAGNIVYEQARQIFKSVQDTYDKINENKNTISGLVKFVSTNSLGMSFLAQYFIKMRDTLPQVDWNFRLGGLNFIRNALRQGEAEFAIVVSDHNFEQFTSHPLKSGQFNLYQHKEAPHHQIENGIFVDHYESMYVKNYRSIRRSQEIQS